MIASTLHVKLSILATPILLALICGAAAVYTSGNPLMIALAVANLITAATLGLVPLVSISDTSISVRKGALRSATRVAIADVESVEVFGPRSISIVTKSGSAVEFPAASLSIADNERFAAWLSKRVRKAAAGRQ